VIFFFFFLDFADFDFADADFEPGFALTDFVDFAAVDFVLDFAELDFLDAVSLCPTTPAGSRKHEINRIEIDF